MTERQPLVVRSERQPLVVSSERQPLVVSTDSSAAAADEDEESGVFSGAASTASISPVPSAGAAGLGSAPRPAGKKGTSSRGGNVGWGGTPQLRKVWMDNKGERGASRGGEAGDFRFPQIREEGDELEMPMLTGGGGGGGSSVLQHNPPSFSYQHGGAGAGAGAGVPPSRSRDGSTGSFLDFITEGAAGKERIAGAVDAAGGGDAAAYAGTQEEATSLSYLVNGLPGLLIAVLLNLFLSMSFGPAFFPASWEFPPSVPRAIGVQMFLFSTTVCQLVMTSGSAFPFAMGMMMVENIPFMHTIAEYVQSRHGNGTPEAFATVLVAFAFSSVVVGAFFYALGAARLGSIVYFFPRHVIVGCIGGVGVFVTKTGFEVSTDLTWNWDTASVVAFFAASAAPLWLVSCAYDVVLRALIARYKDWSVLPPFYFVLIPPSFYLILLATGVGVDTAREHGFFFKGKDPSDGPSSPLMMWQLMDLGLVQWRTIAEMTPTILALTLFSLMHVPINIPSLSVSTRVPTDMNAELKAHGLSNLIVGLLGGCQNYLCYSNSFLYYKCNGGGQLFGYLLSALTAVFFFYGPAAISYVPRCMAGCLLIHVGLDLCGEGLVDSFHAFDTFEYASVVIIAFIMTIYGMTAGLGAGVFLAALTFTLQTGRHVAPVRGVMRATTLQSSAYPWHSPAAQTVLKANSHHITIVQLQGNLFFGNVISLEEEIDRILAEDAARGEGQKEIWCVLLDFTLVLGIDSSAAETISNLPSLARKHKVKMCFACASRHGFPTAAPLTDRLWSCNKGNQSCGAVDLSASAGGVDSSSAAELAHHLEVKAINPLSYVHVADSLDVALQWCENQVVVCSCPALNPIDPLLGRTHIRAFPEHLRDVHVLLNDAPGVERLLAYFTPREAAAGEVLWRQGEVSSAALILVRGRLLSVLEDEAGTQEEVRVGKLVGEYGLLHGSLRLSTLRATTEARLLWLDGQTFTEMEREDPRSAHNLGKLCIKYLGCRVQHVENRIWESHCVPV